MSQSHGTEALRVEGMSVSYGPARAVFGLDLTIGSGRGVGLLGRNGAGKTSTIRGILDRGVRRDGRIVLDGSDVSGLRPHLLARAGIGWVPDDRRCFPTLTVSENLSIARYAVKRRARVAPLSDDEVIDLFPILGPVIRRPAGVLSGGEQQMVSIARGLVSRPKVLLVDEPTEGLSPLAIEQVIASLKRMRRELGQAILLAEAQTDVAREVVEDVLVLSVGKVVYRGTAEEFAADVSLQEQYLALGEGGHTDTSRSTTHLG